MSSTIAGLFSNRDTAEQALTDLEAAGFSGGDMGIVMQDKRQAHEMSEKHGTQTTEGAVAGGIVGGTAGALMAATGALVIPGIGPFVSAGILATSIVGGATGWLAGSLIGLGLPHEEAHFYEQQVQQGGVLVTIKASGREAEARAILMRDGAHDLQTNPGQTQTAGV